MLGWVIHQIQKLTEAKWLCVLSHFAHWIRLHLRTNAWNHSGMQQGWIADEMGSFHYWRRKTKNKKQVVAYSHHLMYTVLQYSIFNWKDSWMEQLSFLLIGSCLGIDHIALTWKPLVDRIFSSSFFSSYFSWCWSQLDGSIWFLLVFLDK